MFFDSYWTSYKSFSLGPRKSMETISQKKAIFPAKKIIRPISSCIFEWNRRQGTTYKGPQCYLIVIGQVVRSFL